MNVGGYVTRKEIFLKLNELNIDKEEYLIVGDAALVCFGVIRNTDVINLSCSKDLYEKLNWISNNNSKSYDCFIISTDNYNKKYTLISDFHFMKLEDLLRIKLSENNPLNKKIIKKIQLLIDCEDTYKNERKLHKSGYKLIGGVDEVGRGPLVGPVVAACCILPEEFNLEGLTDSKKLSEKKRDYFFEEIKKQAISYGIGIVSNERIDEINIYEATKEAMIMAIDNCHVRPDYILTDAMKLDIDIPFTPIIKGDLKSISISAASVLAKVTRDRMMYELDKKYPMYDFKNNVGYPTKKHLDAIDRYGIINEHRKSYAPVINYINKNKNTSD